MSNLKRYRSEEGSDPKMPNLVPTINLFLTIVPFMLQMLLVSQLAMVALDFDPVAKANAPGPGPGVERLFQIYISSSGSVGFRITESGSLHKEIAVANGNYNFLALDEALYRLRREYPQLADIVVAPSPLVRFETLMKTIDLCKKNGFVKVHYEIVM